MKIAYICLLGLGFAGSLESIQDIDQEIQKSNVEITNEEAAKYKTYLEKEKVKTEIMAEKKKQVETEMSIKQIKENAENKTESDFSVNTNTPVVPNVSTTQVNPEVIPEVLPEPDLIQVKSVFGFKEKLFTTIKVNGHKYEVTKGEKVAGYKIKDINKYGVTVEKDGITQFFNVSAEEEPKVEKVEKIEKTPDIRPYQLN